MSGLRRNNSCGFSNQQQFTPYMMGSRTYGGNNSSRVPATMSVNTMASPSSLPNRTYSLNNATTSVQDCLYWPASLGNQSNAYGRTMQPRQYSQTQNYSSPSGDSQYCSAPPKVYLSTPGIKGRAEPQNIPCQIAPLGTDPMSLIKPLAPLTVRVQAPSDLFTGDSSQPRTISISPAQLYGGQ